MEHVPVTPSNIGNNNKSTSIFGHVFHIKEQTAVPCLLSALVGRNLQFLVRMGIRWNSRQEVSTCVSITAICIISLSPFIVFSHPFHLFSKKYNFRPNTTLLYWKHTFFCWVYAIFSYLHLLFYNFRKTKLVLSFKKCIIYIIR